MSRKGVGKKGEKSAYIAYKNAFYKIVLICPLSQSIIN
ncbi:hypothetical protein FH5_01863 [Priestia endophytica]|nr:hypothetical protein FH5_01863 [Priestia endophytica]